MADHGWRITGRPALRPVLVALALHLVAVGSHARLEGSPHIAPFGFIPDEERRALFALYHSTNGAGWTRSANWLGSPGTESSWFGVTVTADHVTAIDLSANNLTGTLPAELGDLRSLHSLNLAFNDLQGPIPHELGNLTQLVDLELGGNMFVGVIPTSLGNLASLVTLDLQGNHLGGAVPAELSNLTALTSLRLASNRLRGALPQGLTGLVGLVDGQSDIRWNALWTDDTSLATFLDRKQQGGDWRSTQTVQPRNPAPRVANITHDTIRLEWTPTAYTADPGYYEVAYSLTPGGPYNLPALPLVTNDKSTSTLVVPNLMPVTPYYFVVRTATRPHVSNANLVVSEDSIEVPVITRGAPFDVLSPSLTVDPLPAVVYSPVIAVSGTATDSGSGETGISRVSVNGVDAAGPPVSGWATVNWSVSYRLTPGLNLLSILAYDGYDSPSIATPAQEFRNVEYIPCFTLLLTHVGSGGDPAAIPASSPGCALGEYLPGEAISVTASPSAGWTVHGWAGTNDDRSRANTNTLTMPGAAHQVSVEYADLNHLFYVIDGFGGVHAGGASPPLTPPTPYWQTDVGVDLELAPTGAYVLDALGGVHAGGGAPVITPATPYFGFAAARDLELWSAGYFVLDHNGIVHAGGGLAPVGQANIAPPAAAIDLEWSGSAHYILDDHGEVHATGGAPPISPGTPHFGFDIARDLEFLVTGGMYVLDGYGGVHAGGGATPVDPAMAPPYFDFDIAEDLEVVATGLYVLDAMGGVHAGAGAPLLTGRTPYFGFDIARDLELR